MYHVIYQCSLFVQPPCPQSPTKGRSKTNWNSQGDVVTGGGGKPRKDTNKKLEIQGTNAPIDPSPVVSNASRTFCYNPSKGPFISDIVQGGYVLL